MVSALPVFGLVIDGAAHHLYLAAGEVPLEVGCIILSIPQAELHEAEQVNFFLCVRNIFQNNTVDLAVVLHRDEGLKLHFQSVFHALDDRVAQTMTAGIAVQFGLNRLPAGIPNGIAVLDVIIPSALIQTTVVVAVTGQPQQLGILIERVAACGVGDQAEKFIAS